MNENEKVKLVIWDLDGTLWQNNLAEGDLTFYANPCTQFIIPLANKGIMNSICSKNDFNKAKIVLQKLDIWDYFVFPKIGYFSKGQAVKNILEDMHIRPENAIFVDDDVANHVEVQYYNKNIKTIKPEHIQRILFSLIFKDNDFYKNDFELKRLSQYKLLEQKTTAQQNFKTNEEFLKNSNIVVKLLPLETKHIDRAYELITRTNQLNFTKKRISKEEILEIIKDKTLTSKLIQVKDNYGDYGIVGLYVLDKNNTLIHFVFSCRIMNMGIEQFIYNHLNYPNINLVGNTAVNLEKNKQIDYIKLTDNNTKQIKPEEYLSNQGINLYKKNILAIGACEIILPISYLSKTNNNIYLENPYYDINKGIRIGNTMTEHLRACIKASEKEKSFCKKYFLHYNHDRAFSSFLFQNIWDYVILTFHDDAEWDIYKHKKQGFNVIANDEIKMLINSNLVKEDEKDKWLKDNFYDGKKITRKRFYDNIMWIVKHLDKKTKIVLITCPTIEHFTNVKQAKKLNTIIRYLGKKFKDKFCVLEINDLIHDVKDILEYGYHLNAENTYNLYLNIMNVIKRNFPKNTPNIFKEISNGRKVCLLGNNIFELKNAYYILDFENSTPNTIAYHNLTEKDLKLYSKDIQKIINQNNNIEIKNLDEINKAEYYIVIANEYKYNELKEYLIKKGFEPRKDFVFFDNNLMSNAGDIYNVDWNKFKKV